MNKHKALIFLSVAQSLGILFFFPYYAFFFQDDVTLRYFSVGISIVTILSLWSVFTRKPWALWLVLSVTSFKLTIDLFAWATNLDRSFLQVLSQSINVGIIFLAFKAQLPSRSKLSSLHKLFYAFVLGLALLIGIWGLFIPERVLDVLPIMVPPLHARFLGAMYLSGATFMGLCLLATDWSEARVVTPMIAIWTGMLGFISLFYLEAFDWGREQTWIWFIAYICYPLIAAWVTWQQRSHTHHLPGSPLSKGLRTYLWLQSGLFTILAICLFIAPAAMVNVWPWNITPFLAHIYSAPFLSYGLGSLYALTQNRWQEVRIVVYSTLVFTLGVLISSFYHLPLFDFTRLSVWVWFISFSLTSLFLAFFGFSSRLHRSSGTSKNNP